jgi:tRNA1Val (adenine37-N6)-methyltransferase
MTDYLREGERFDDLERCGYRIIQNPKAFCFGMDAVLLSSFTRVSRGDNVLDLCCGNGIIPILLRAKTQGRHFSGIEIQPYIADMAIRSVAANGLQADIDIIEGDIRQVGAYFGKATFDVVTVNPPYLPVHAGLQNRDSAKNIARHEIVATLTDVLCAANIMLRTGGRLYIVHRPTRLAQIFECLAQNNLQPKRMRLVHPYIDSPPDMVLIEAVRGGRPELKCEKPLIIFERQGVYTDEVGRIYRF